MQDFAFNYYYTLKKLNFAKKEIYKLPFIEGNKYLKIYRDEKNINRIWDYQIQALIQNATDIREVESFKEYFQEETEIEAVDDVKIFKSIIKSMTKTEKTNGKNRHSHRTGS